ncbi:hypothetical protein AGMMS49546_02180 [Spirochaetia bacterium]|nr:hypothetical protein AGMMS49546_02180 [Spirochaetia bacterium]
MISAAEQAWLPEQGAQPELQEPPFRMGRIPGPVPVRKAVFHPQQMARRALAAAPYQFGVNG